MMTDFSRYGVVETAPQEDRRVPRKILPARTDQRRRLPGRQKSGLLDFPSERFSFENGYLQQRVRIVCSPDMRATVISSTSAFLKITKSRYGFQTLFRDDRANPPFDTLFLDRDGVISAYCVRTITSNRGTNSNYRWSDQR